MNEVMVPITQGLAYVNRVQIRKVTHILKVDVSWFLATKVGEAVDVKYDALAHKVYFKTDYELEDGWCYRASICRILHDIGDNPYRLDLAVYRIQDLADVAAFWEKRNA